jgi:hypothetical protein
MAGLVSTDDLDARGITYASVAVGQAAIDDASAVARTCVGTLLDDVETPDAPAAVVAIVCGMVRRQLTNPRALTQESLGDYSYSSGGDGGVASLFPTKRERQLLRRAVGALGASSVAMEGYLPVMGTETVSGETDSIIGA